MTRFLQAVFFWVNVIWIRLVVAVVISKKVEGRENIPSKGPVILVCNHLNFADPPTVLSLLPRRSKWLVKEEWFRNPIIGLPARAGGLMPVRRSKADFAALRRAQAVLGQGLILGIFPEGTRSKTGMLGEGEPGAAYLALRTGVPILPVAVFGTEKIKLPKGIFQRNKGIHVRFGKVFRLEKAAGRIENADVAAANRRIMLSIRDMLPSEYHGVYSERKEGEVV